MPGVSVSVVTATFHREDLLRRCVESVLGQPADVVLEHIVVNDSGRPLAPAPWMRDPRVRVLDTQGVERCAARNAGAALARGEWLYFLDDDDYALPGAFRAQLLAVGADRPVMLYGGYRVQDETASRGESIVPTLRGDVFPQLLAGETFPTHAVWLRRDAFFSVGGFDPHMVYAEDVDLFRRVSLLGVVGRTEDLVAVARIHHPATTTTDPALRLVRWRRSLEKCLAGERTLPRVLEATRQSPYWRGRCRASTGPPPSATSTQGSTAGRSAARLGRRHVLLTPFRRGLQRDRSLMPPLDDKDGMADGRAKKKPVAV